MQLHTGASPMALHKALGPHGEGKHGSFGYLSSGFRTMEKCK